MQRGLLFFFLLLSITTNTKAQKATLIGDKEIARVISFNQIEYIEDRSGRLTFQEISSSKFNSKFTPSKYSTPQNYNTSSAYWYRIHIKCPDTPHLNWMLDFFDQTIDDIKAYVPDTRGGYQLMQLGASRPFNERLYEHKNFAIQVNAVKGTDDIYYFRVKSQQSVNIIIVIAPYNWFLRYATNEYLLFGVFYGMIIVFAFYNFLMFLAIRQKQYIYYILYIISVGIYQMCTDGLAYQYLWPNWPNWNEYAYGTALCCVSVFALFFSSKLLNLKSNSIKLYRLLNIVALIRVLYFFICLLFHKQLFVFKFIDAIPLSIAFYAGIYTWKKGYRPARFFVIGYGFIFFGMLVKSLIAINAQWLNGWFGYYSLNICFILEMLFLGFAMGDKVRILKKEKDLAQEERIQEFILNEQLKDTLNNKLEQQVNERTKEVIEKAKIIDKQNEELKNINILLEAQSIKILGANVLLEHDNVELKTNVEKISKARIMSADVDFEEFSKIYPDKESCFKFLAELKWHGKYECRKCKNDHFYSGHSPYSRRCSKCGYDESVTAYTIFQNSRIPIAKAFYMVFLIYSSKGKISSYQLSETLNIRQSTCWAYSNKIKKLLSENKKLSRTKNAEGWSTLILEKA